MEYYNEAITINNSAGKTVANLNQWQINHNNINPTELTLTIKDNNLVVNNLFNFENKEQLKMGDEVNIYFLKVKISEYNPATTKPNFIKKITL